MSKLSYCAQPIFRIYRCFHTSFVLTARGSRVPSGPVEFVENKAMKATSSPVIDEIEEQPIELSRKEVVQEIQQSKEQIELRQFVNDAMPPFEKLPNNDKTLG